MPDQTEFPDFAGGFVFFGFLHFQVCHDDPGEGVGAGFEFGPAVLVVEEFDGAEVEGEVGFGEVEAVLVGSPVGVGVAEDGDADGGLAEVVEDAEAVDEDAFGELGFGGGLDFDVEEQDEGAALFTLELDELVGVAFAEFGVGGDREEFFVEEDGGYAPVYDRGDGGEEEFDGFLEVLGEDALPGGVLGVFLGWRWWGHGVGCSGRSGAIVS